LSEDIMLKKYYWIITLVFALGACDEEAPKSDSGTDPTEPSDESGADEAEAADISPDESLDGEELPSACGVAMIPGCGQGRLCVQTQPPYCSADYIGYCMTVPDDCSDVPEHMVCACDTLTIYRNECEARQAGFGGLLIECP
jgi:starvation-inducible outer membrane lipoprotein